MSRKNKQLALVLGLNEDALTFSRAALAAVGETGTVEPPVGGAGLRLPLGLGVPVPEGVPLVDVAGVPAFLLPLNGGIAGITIGIFLSTDASAGLVVVVTLDALPVLGGGATAGGGVAPTTALVDKACVAGLRTASGTLAGIPRDADVGLVAPIARALVEDASRSDLSFIAFCFSLSFARIGTKSSGIGLLSCKCQTEPTQPIRKTYLERLAELDQLRQPLIHFVLDESLPLLRQPLLLIGDEISECGKRVGGRLEKSQHRRNNNIFPLPCWLAWQPQTL